MNSALASVHSRPGFSQAPQVKFGKVEEHSQYVRWIVTQGHVDEYNQKTLPLAKELDVALEAEGVKTSDDLKMYALFPKNIIQYLVKDDATRTSLQNSLRKAGVTQSHTLGPNYKKVSVQIKTFAEQTYENGLPWTFVTRKYNELKAKVKGWFKKP